MSSAVINAPGSTAHSRPPRNVRRLRFSARHVIGCIVVLLVAAVIAAAVVPTTRWVRAEGMVNTASNVNLRPSVEGAIDKVLVDSGAGVQRGQLLVQLNDAVQRASRARAQADIDARGAELSRLQSSQVLQRDQRREQITQARLSLDLSRRHLEKMAQGAGFSHKEVEDAELRVQLAQSRLTELSLAHEPVMAKQIEVMRHQIAAAAKGLVRIDVELELRKIRAPLDGTVHFHRIEAGEVIKPEHVLGQIFDRNSWVVTLQVPERHIAYLAEGQPASVGLAPYPRLRYGTFEARVSRIEKIVTPRATGDGFFYVEARLPQPESIELNPGITAWADIDAGRTTWLRRLIGW